MLHKTPKLFMITTYFYAEREDVVLATDEGEARGLIDPLVALEDLDDTDYDVVIREIENMDELGEYFWKLAESHDIPVQDGLIQEGESILELVRDRIRKKKKEQYLRANHGHFHFWHEMGS